MKIPEKKVNDVIALSLKCEAARVTHFQLTRIKSYAEDCLMRLKVIFNCNLPILEESLFLDLLAIANKSAGVYIEIKRVSWGGGGVF